MTKSKNIPSPPAPPAPHRSDSKEIVLAILQAARQLPVDASLQAIADRAGVGVASVYRYFPGRDAIYAELGRRLRTQLLRQVKTVMAAATTLEEAAEACTALALERSFGERHVIEHVHLNLPSTWHSDGAITQEIIDVVALHLGRFLVATPHELADRAVMLMILLRGSSRVALMMPDLVPDSAIQTRLLRAAVLACATDGLTRRAEPLDHVHTSAHQA